MTDAPNIVSESLLPLAEFGGRFQAQLALGTLCGAPQRRTQTQLSRLTSSLFVLPTKHTPRPPACPGSGYWEPAGRFDVKGHSPEYVKMAHMS
jgi:hypothetical protein